MTSVWVDDSSRQYARDVTEQDIVDLVSAHQRESNDLEFKQTADADLLKAACGIANAGGGYILVGLAEDDQHCASKVVGVQDADKEEDSIRQCLRDGLAPRPIIEVVVLAVQAVRIIVVRVSPQNQPHMVSQDKRTDFYGRYDATTEKMRYEEIEQRFREKHESGEIDVVATPRAVIETIGGRTSISQGAKGVFDSYVARVCDSQESTFTLIGVSDGNKGSPIAESDAVAVLSDPLYRRDGGWVIAHASLDVIPESGIWAQRYGQSSTTTISPSGDLIFLKAVDEVLCWRQTQEQFSASPRIYPNALVEYCLSFAYALADIAARTAPQQIIVTPILSHMKGVNLPLGEGGSVWFDSPIQPPRLLESKFAEGLPVPIEIAGNRPVHARHVAFLLAAQVYALFGYSQNQVAFASDFEITQESDPDIATLTSICGYLQNVFRRPLRVFNKDIRRDLYWLGTQHSGKPYRIGVSAEFVEDHHWVEKRLFNLIDTFDLVRFENQAGLERVVIVTNDGPRYLPWSAVS